MVNKVINLYKKYEEIVNYVVVGALTTLVSVVSYFLFRFFVFTDSSQLHIQICNVISWILAVLFAFFTNKKYVFKSKAKGAGLIEEMVKFYSARVATLLIEMASMWFMVDLININDKISKIIAQFIVLVLNYVFSKLFVFRKKETK